MSPNVPHIDKRSRLIAVWFVLDAVIALAPPLYWAADRNRTFAVLGLPTSLFYFIAVAIFVTASIVAAYWIEAAQGEFDS